MSTDNLLEGAREDLRRGFAVRADTRLRQAITAGSAEALNLFASALLQGRIPGGASVARTSLEAGAKLMTPATRMLRAALRYAGIGGAAQPQAALDDLNRAAVAGLPQAIIEVALGWLEQEGDQAIRAARDGLTHIAETTPAARQMLALLPKIDTKGKAGNMPPLENWPPPRRTPQETLCSSPRIERFRAALTPIECAWLRASAQPRLAPSLIVDPRSGRPRPDPTRTGQTMYFDFSTQSLYVYRLAGRMAHLAGHAADCAEPLAVLCYTPGQEYKPHYDCLGTTGLARDPLRVAGDRAATVLGYLNVPEAGGATLFTQLAIRVEPALGDVLVFANLDPAGRPEQHSQHAGEPVEAGEKWLASLWIRQQSVRF